MRVGFVRRNSEQSGVRVLSLAGVDLAWNTERNGSGVAHGSLTGDGRLIVQHVRSGVIGEGAVLECLLGSPNVDGIGIDASLIIKNEAGHRVCETALSREYARRHAGCHASNLALYPDASSVRLAAALEARGYRHLGDPFAEKFLIECYPHPALIEMFGLSRRLAYKKGTKAQRLAGQIELARLLRTLERSDLVRLVVPTEIECRLDATSIGALKGKALKHNEDALDAIVCLYVCALYAIAAPHRTFGNVDDGYIVVPAVRCA
jgi:predicted RNase H-like nuclease